MKEIRIPLRRSVPLLLFGLFLLWTSVVLMVDEHAQIMMIRDGRAENLAFLMLVTVGVLLLDLGIRLIRRRQRAPARHIVSSWALYLIGGVWLMTGFANLLYGALSGLIVVSMGMALSSYVYRRPKRRDPKTYFRYQVPISELNWWNSLFLARTGQCYLVGAIVIIWIIPWGLLSASAWHRYLVVFLMPYMPGLKAFHDQAANPEFAVGLVSMMPFITVLTVFLTVAQSQVADRVVTGEYPVRDAIKAFVVMVCLLVAMGLYYPIAGAGESYLARLSRESDFCLVLQQMSFLVSINVFMALALSFGKGLYLVGKRVWEADNG